METYQKIQPISTYSPWNEDTLFLSTYESIRKNTLVDKYRCYELWKLTEQVSKFKHGSIIEIGVWRGGTGALIARQAKKLGIEDPVFLCDTFSGVVKSGPNDSFYKGGEHSDTSREITEELIFDTMGLDNVKILHGIFPDETAHIVDNIKFRLCHIDVDVYNSARDIVDWIWEKMIPGGLLIYDDYGFVSCDGITKYVNEQMQLNDRLVFHNLNGHAVVIKL